MYVGRTAALGSVTVCANLTVALLTASSWSAVMVIRPPYEKKEGQELEFNCAGKVEIAYPDFRLRIGLERELGHDALEWFAFSERT